ncbi:unnamed protein product [Ambrosiozyma monospora]|uniref:Unnamed protein product n=1 Tax=Ambrosiozyma monospora TaxID=43982 RepID=A0ACB5T6B6_AMBMO|nr:unnamed protein product [Ambrosiozyma monospora]
MKFLRCNKLQDLNHFDGISKIKQKHKIGGLVDMDDSIDEYDETASVVVNPEPVGSEQHRSQQLAYLAEDLTSEPSNEDEDLDEKNAKVSPSDIGSIKPGSASDETSAGAVQKKASRFELSVERRLIGGKSGHDHEGIKRHAAALSQKLRTTFGISEDDEFAGDYPCWLVSEVLLQGHLYVTMNYILFFAFLPNKPGSVLKSGYLTTKSYPSMREHRKWALLKDNTLALYSSSTDLYFPYLVIDLRTALRAEVYGGSNHKQGQPIWIRVITEKKTHWFLTDLYDSARSWVSAIKKQIFSARNEGGQVAIKIPLQNILDLELTTVLGLTKNLRIKVIESLETYALDDYFLMFFSKGDEAVKLIKSVIKNAGVELSDSGECDSEEDSPMIDSLIKSRIELLKKSSSCVQSTSGFQPHNKNGSDFVISVKSEDDAISQKMAKCDSALSNPTPPVEELPPDEDEPPAEAQTDATAATSKRNWPTAKSLVDNITCLISAASQVSHYDENTVLAQEGQDPYFVKDPEARKIACTRFRDHFSLNEDEKLIAAYHAYLVRGLPTYGKLYVGQTCLYFRSLLPGSRTLMILPFTDIENINKEKGFRFGYSGLVVVIHGHEELFFEFPHADGRDDCETLILKRIDVLKPEKKHNHGSANTTHDSDSYKLAEPSSNLTTAKLRLFENKINDELGFDVPIIIENNPHTKTKISTTKKLRFTLLTIGSRGDVQPYIALGKALLKEGHQVKIVSHEEFGDWVRKHGIEFDIIAGDPSELMALMVTNPTINYSFHVKILMF